MKYHRILPNLVYCLTSIVFKIPLVYYYQHRLKAKLLYSRSSPNLAGPIARFTFNKLLCSKFHSSLKVLEQLSINPPLSYQRTSLQNHPSHLILSKRCTVHTAILHTFTYDQSCLHQCQQLNC